MTVKNILEKDESLITGYKVKFFIGGNKFVQKYRVNSVGGGVFFLFLYNSSKLKRGQLTKTGLKQTEILYLFDDISIVKCVEEGQVVKNNKRYHYLVAKFIPGESLQERLERDGALSQYAAVPIAIKILKALSLLHDHKNVVVHNDINLENIWLDYSTDFEIPVLSGFSSACYISDKINGFDLGCLNPFYIAPELYNGVFSPQSDIFAVGALLYHLIIGVPPWYVEIPRYQRGEEEEVEAVENSRRNRLNFGRSGSSFFIDDSLKAALQKSLSLDVDNRYATAIDFIEGLLGKEQPTATCSSTERGTASRSDGKGAQGFSAIAGMQDLKDILYNDVIRALNEPELYKRYGVTIPNGVLLYGPPGCGKTFIAERFSEEVGFNFLKLKPSDLKSKWVNDTELKIASVFNEAVINAPSIIFIDEFDAVVPSREKNLHEMNASAVNELLTHMSSCSERGVFVIAASNRPEKIDPAILRTGRIDRMVYLPPPDYEARAAMFEIYLENRPIDLSIDYYELAFLTNNYVSSDIKFLVDEASRVALKSKIRITQSMLKSVIDITNPSVSYSEIERYRQLSESFDGL